MTKKNRLIIFIFLAILFLIVAPLVILYSLGYRIDFEGKRITKTGGFYFKVWPKNAQILIHPSTDKFSNLSEGNLTKKTDFFFGAAFIKNLLPKKYEVEIRKDGYHPWKKNLEIKEKEVTDAKNVLLIPESPELSILNKDVDCFFLSPDEKKAILKENSPSGWALKIFDLEKNVKSPLIEDKDIYKGELNLGDLKFSPDSKAILLRLDFDGEEKYILLNLEYNPLAATPTPALFFLDFLKGSKEVFFHPQNSQNLFFLREESLFNRNLLENATTSKFLENVISLEIPDKDIYYLTGAGFLFKTDFSFLSKEKINQIPISIAKGGDYKITTAPDGIFIQNREQLFSFNYESNSFEKIFENPREFKISPDSKKAVYTSDSEIWILFLKAELGQPQKSALEQVFIARFSEKIGKIFWLTDYYLIFDCGNKIKIAEIDDRDGINIVDFSEFKKTANSGCLNFYLSDAAKKMFILNNGNFYSIANFLP